MKDILTHKDFLGSVHFNSRDEIFFGRIEGIDDLVTFEGASVKELKRSFQEAVEDYLELCAQAEKKPERSYRGSFNVRIPVTLHRKAKQTALALGVSLNQFIQKAVEDELVTMDKA